MIETATGLVTDNPGMAAGMTLLVAVVFFLVGFSSELFKRSDIEQRLRASPDTWGGTGRSEVGDGGSDAVRSLFSYVEANFRPDVRGRFSELQRDLVVAGFFGKSAISWFYFARISLTVSLAVLTFVTAVLVLPQLPLPFLLGIGLMGGMLGLILPAIYIDQRARGNKEENMSGFPDFLDLLVVATEAGLSIDAAVLRVTGEIAESYPSLGANLHMMSLEMRAGRPIQDALQTFADRVDLPEVKAFATLLRQSAELGTSLADALRIYSDDMRHKRLSRAEEKAHSLPVKLVLPLGLFVFPVVLVVVLLPVGLRLLKVFV
jgi:tight adherence protein C